MNQLPGHKWYLSQNFAVSAMQLYIAIYILN